MKIGPLFTIKDPSSHKIRYFPKKYCWMQTILEDGRIENIYGKKPIIEIADGELVVIYTEQFNSLTRYANKGKRMMVSLSVIIDAQAWDFN